MSVLLIHQVPADSLYDIVASRAIIDNDAVMHHMTMYGCVGDLSDSSVSCFRLLLVLVLIYGTSSTSTTSTITSAGT